MAAIDVLAVRQPLRMRDVLQDAFIDDPAVAPASDSIWLGGWMIGAASRAVAVEVLYRNRILAVAPIDIRRADVETTHPELGDLPCGFERAVSVTELEGEFDLMLRTILEDGSRVSTGSIKVRRAGHAGAGESAGEADGGDELGMRAAYTRLEAEVERLIAAALEGRPPPPAPQADFLDYLDLFGRRVLVVGSGLGDLARTLRTDARAGLVDVLEAEPALAKIERVITAHRDVSRVSFFEADPADPRSYDSGYGAVVAPLGMEGLEPALPRIAKITKVLVTKLGPGKQVVPEAVGELFPHQQILGDEASNGRTSSTRMIVLARTAEALDAVLRTPAAV